MKIIIIDDDPIVCESLSMITEIGSKKGGEEEIEVVAKGYDGKEAFPLYEKHRPDILLLDIRMKEVNGLEAAKNILATYPDAKILFLTTFLDDEYIIEALRIGAKGYLVKSKVESVLPALYAIRSNQRVFGDEIVDKLPQLIDSQQARKENKSPSGDYFAALTDKEWHFVRLIAEGKNNREIADDLHFSEGTVRNYLSVILDKLGLRDRTQLAVAYYKYGKE